MASNMETCKPKWMNTSFFESALRSAKEDDITVISSEVKAATAPGDNYGSDMYRAIVKFRRENETEETSIIVKASKQEHAKVAGLRNIFDKETAAFAIVLPEMFNLMNEVPSLSNQPFSAKYFHSHSDETASSIVMEDLKVKGFRLAENRLSGLDLQHCLLATKTIARFHAASLVLYRKDPTMFKPFMNASFSTDDTGEDPLFAGYVTRVAKEVEKWPEYRVKFLDKLHNIRDTVKKQWRKGIIRNDEEFNVLCHGDLWLNNMMFRYSDDTGDVEEVRLVDFQLSYWTSPAVDLHYFIHTSASAEALEQREVLIQEYHNTLCETLTLLKHPHLQPSMATINRELENRGFYAVVCTIVLRSVMLADRSKTSDFVYKTEENDTIQLSDVYKVSLKKLLLEFEARGWI